MGLITYHVQEHSKNEEILRQLCASRNFVMNGNNLFEQKATSVRSTVQDDNFWETLSYYADLLEPIACLTIKYEGNAARISDCYHDMTSLVESFLLKASADMRYEEFPKMLLVTARVSLGESYGDFGTPFFLQMHKFIYQSIPPRKIIQKGEAPYFSSNYINSYTNPFLFQS
jgi:hypothetical protein